jgi:hypothetical protein
MFTSPNKAITALINDYGDDGGGQKIAIEIDAKHDFKEWGWYLQGRLDTADLRWISIFSKNNEMLNLSGVQLIFTCSYAPIFNCKMSFKRKPLDKNNLPYCMLRYSGFLSYITLFLTFGRNTVIEYFGDHTMFDSNGTTMGFEAKYGIIIRSNNTLSVSGFERFLVNKGRFEFTRPKYNNCILIQLHHLLGNGTCKMYNTTIALADDDGSNEVGLLYSNKVNTYLENVTSTDRKGKKRGLQVYNAIVTMKDCNFASKTDGTLNDGHDIVVVGESSVIHLQNTTGNRNQVPGKKTKDGIIIQH